LIELEKNLEEALIESNSTIKWEDLLNIFMILNNLYFLIKNAGPSIEGALLIKNSDFIGTHALKLQLLLPPPEPSFWKRLPLKFSVHWDNIWKPLTGALSVVMSPVEYLLHLFNSHYEKQNYRLKIKEEKQKWKNLTTNRQHKVESQEKQKSSDIKILKVMYEIKQNQQLYSSIKVKNILRSTIDMITKEEELLSLWLCQGISTSIIAV